MPTDFEAMAGANGFAIVACLWVAIVFCRRYIVARHLPRLTVADTLYPWMLLTMTAVALLIAGLLSYRLVYAVAHASESAAGVRWFQDNRVVGTTITAALGAAMLAKLRYPLASVLGRWWVPAAASVAVVVFFSWAYLPRLL